MGTKEWDWSKNKSDYWLTPTIEMPYLAERWQQKGFQKILDLGAGLGRHSVFFAKRGFTVSAFDLSDYGIKHLTDWANREGISIDTKVGNMLSLPYETESMDALVAYNVLYHCTTEEFQKALAECARVLRPGGEIFLTMISKDSPSYQNAQKEQFLDRNTILRDESDTERNVPHFFVNIEDIRPLFHGFIWELPPAEIFEFISSDPHNSTKHWRLLLKKTVDSEFQLG